MLPEDVDALLRFEAKRRGLSIADVVREAIEQYLPSPAEDLGFFAIGEGRPRDASERVDELVGRAIRRHRTSRA